MSGSDGLLGQHSAGHPDGDPGGHGDASARTAAFWARGLGHVLRNQQTALTHALFAFGSSGGEPVAPEVRAECLDVGHEALSRSIALLEAFSALVPPRGARPAESPGHLIRHAAVLLGPRLRRREATLRVEGDAIRTPVDGIAMSDALCAVCGSFLERSGTGSTIVLELVEEDDDIRLRAGLEGGDETASEAANEVIGETIGRALPGADLRPETWGAHGRGWSIALLPARGSNG